jgi:hypothetical protein
MTGGGFEFTTPATVPPGLRFAASAANRPVPITSDNVSAPIRFADSTASKRFWFPKIDSVNCGHVSRRQIGTACG